MKNEIVKYDDLIGSKYQEWGRFEDEEGIDCFGIALEISKRLGKKIIKHESTDKHNFNVVDNIIVDFRHHYNKVQTPKAGDLVLLNMRHSIKEQDWSVGIMVDDVHFLHTTKEMGVYTARIDDAQYIPFIEGFYSGDTIHLYPGISLHGGAIGSILSIVGGVVGRFLPFPFNLIVPVAFALGGNLLFSGVSEAPTSSASSKTLEEESPTYGFNAGNNTSEEGLAIPVVYGENAVWPEVINAYLDVDSDGNQWAHRLFCIGEGLTNNLIRVEDIYLDDQPLTLLSDNTYEMQTNDGDTDQASNTIFDERFSQLHQYRELNNKIERADGTIAALLHYDSDGSSLEPIKDEGGATWNFAGTASLDFSSAALPVFGDGILDISNSGDSINCDNKDVFDIYLREAESPTGISVADQPPPNIEFDFETFFKFGGLASADTDGCQIAGYDVRFTIRGYVWSFYYLPSDGTLHFQLFTTDLNGSWQATDLVYDASTDLGSGELLEDTWYHLRFVNSSSKVVYFYVDGIQVGSGAELTPFVTSHVGPEASWTGPRVNSPRSMIGRGTRNEGGNIDNNYYAGQCKLDETRMIVGGTFRSATANFTVPTSAYTAPGIGLYNTWGDIDRIAIMLEWKQGLYELNDDAETINASVSIELGFRRVGTSEWSLLKKTITAKQTQPLRKLFTFFQGSFGTGRGEYEVKVVRLTENTDDDTRVQTQVWWTGVDEILNEFLIYPDLQILALSVQAQDEYSGAIPIVKVITNRTSIIVPTFDGTSTQAVNPTNNAYAAFDMLTSSLYGAGVDPTKLVQVDWEAWRDYCDTLIAFTVFPSGVLRCEFNMIFDGNYDLSKALQYPESSGRAKIINRGLKLGIIIDQPETSSYVFNQANTKTEKNMMTYIPKIERSDAVEVEFINRDELWIKDRVIAHTANFETLTTVPRIVKIFMPSMNTAQQALREATLRQQISESIRRSIVLQSGIESIRSIKGDVISYQHPGNSNVVGGRIDKDIDGNDTYTGTTIYIDQAIVLDASTYSGNAQIIVKGIDDVLTTYTISGPFDNKTNAFSIEESAGGTFNRFDPFIIGRASGEIYDYRITVTQRTTKQEVRLEAVQYDESAYFHQDVDGGVVPI